MYATIRIYGEAEGLADAVAENKADILGRFGEIDGFRSYYMVKTGPASARAAMRRPRTPTLGDPPRSRWPVFESRFTELPPCAADRDDPFGSVRTLATV